MPFFAAVSLAVALVAAPQAPADSPPPQAPVATAPAAAPVLAQAVPAPQPTSGLPRRAPEPRTMADYWPVFAALAVVWIGIIGYVLALGRRSRSLARTLYRIGPDEGEMVDRAR